MAQATKQHGQLLAVRDEARRLAQDSDGALRERLQNSVIRPLSDVLNRMPDSGAQPEPVAQGRWELTQSVTALAGYAEAPPEVIEAAAALQSLASEAEIGELAARSPRLQVAPDGPYLVSGAERLADHLGQPIATRPLMALCRCGASKMKPFCDGSHAAIGFSGEKDPARVADRQDTYVGQQVTVLDNRGICQHSGLCTDRLATVFHSGGEPFVTPSGGRMDEIIRAVRDCPSGALSYAMDDVEARGQVDHAGQREPAIEVTLDGPYRVTGSLPLDGADRAAGASDEHYALCRCGQSRNKPFCSGMHYYVGFHDPVADPAAQPSIFAWAGGLPALTRMTRIFYEKYVPADPLLGPIFANMSADHPERVAKWLGEVFGGPTSYSEEYGGYPRMIAEHVGKRLTEEWRARWVSLLLASARDAGLPNDPEFRSALSSYLEWGSRLAVENSQTDARPPENMPMPRWGWNTAAGPPGSRISALSAPVTEDEPPLPSATEPLSFEGHIKALFRARDRNSMSFVFDLWSYDDVRAQASAILGRLRDGSMPCDGAWPAEKIDVFARWIESGTPG